MTPSILSAMALRMFCEVVSALALEQIRQMRAAIGRGDAPAVRHLAHKLKGAASSLGAQRLARVCAQLLRLARTGSLSRAVRLVERLERELAHASAFLREAAAAAPQSNA